MNDLVIARYNEPLEWIQLVPPGLHVHVYNKGQPIASEPVQSRARIIERRNVGRESESYLTHMLEHGPGLGDFTVFCQGDPFEHSPDFLELLARPDEWQPIQPLSWCWKEAANVPPPALLQTRAASQGLRVRPELFSLATWNPVEFIDVGAARTGHAYRNVCGLPEGSNLASHFFASCGLRNLADCAARHLVGRFAYGAIFAVDNQLIAELPAAALRRMRDAALGPACHGYMIERLWLHLFGEPFALPACHAPPMAGRRPAQSLVPMPALAKL
jgi:hypothetical protein